MSNHGEAQHRDVAVPPSLRSRGELSSDLRRELADARLRLQEAALRAEAHRLLGSEHAAAEAVAEQEALLEHLRERLDRSVSAAVLHRDVEDVLAAVAAEPAGPAEPTPRTPPSTPSTPSTPAPRRPALAGAVSLVVALVIGSLAIVSRTPPELDVLGAAEPSVAVPDDAPSGTVPAVPPSGGPTGQEPGTGTSAAAATTGAAATSVGPDGVAAPAPGPGDESFGDLVGRLAALASGVPALDVPAVGISPGLPADAGTVDRLVPDPGATPDVPSSPTTPPSPAPTDTETATEPPLPVDPPDDDPLLDTGEVPQATESDTSSPSVASDGFVSDTGGQ